MSKITIQLLGGASLRSGTALLAGPPVQRHRIALLALMASAWPQPLSRDRAMALLWPERPLKNARRLLNLAVHVLRGALGDGAIMTTVDGLLLDAAEVDCDLQAFCAAVAEGRHAEAVQLHAGPLLDGFHLPESVEFGHWLDEERARCTGEYVDALLALADEQERTGDHRGRIATARRLAAADPHSAAFAQKLMRALAAAGEVGAARQHARHHAERRRADLDLPPDPAVEALARQLEGGVVRGLEVRGAPPAPVPTVAVLPFRNLGLDAGDQCFADGLTDDIVARLLRVPRMRVISRASATPCKPGEGVPGELPPELGVTARLTGSVRREGTRVRIVAQLVASDPEHLLWGETYDRELGDALRLQEELARMIVGALEGVLAGEKRSGLRPTAARAAIAS